jgi:hypothetical protein
VLRKQARLSARAECTEPAALEQVAVRLSSDAQWAGPMSIAGSIADCKMVAEATLPNVSR